MGTHTKRRHTILHYILALIATCFHALFVWYAGWLLSMSTIETGISGRQSKSKGSSSQKSKGKEKESTNLDYDHTRFTKK